MIPHLDKYDWVVVVMAEPTKDALPLEALLIKHLQTYLKKLGKASRLSNRSGGLDGPIYGTEQFIYVAWNSLPKLKDTVHLRWGHSLPPAFSTEFLRDLLHHKGKHVDIVDHILCAAEDGRDEIDDWDCCS